MTLASNFVEILPAVNAGLNAAATCLLVAGVVFIKQKNIPAHKACMLGAFGASCLFLALYLLHKALRAASGGGLHTSFNRQGLAKAAYLAILFSHLVLAITVPVFAVLLIRFGLTGQNAKHRALAKIGFPVWLYVSVTGVVIYFMLYHWNLPLP